MSKYSDPKHIRLYHMQESTIDAMLQDTQFCQMNRIGSLSDIVRTSLTPYLREYELHKQHQKIIGR